MFVGEFSLQKTRPRLADSFNISWITPILQHILYQVFFQMIKRKVVKLITYYLTGVKRTFWHNLTFTMTSRILCFYHFWWGNWFAPSGVNSCTPQGWVFAWFTKIILPFDRVRSDRYMNGKCLTFFVGWHKKHKYSHHSHF